MSREQDMTYLFKNVDVKNPEMLQVFLSKNFAEIENRMQIIQSCLKGISGGSVVDVVTKVQQSFADTSAALIAATYAQEAADGNIQGFFQDAEPTEGMSFGDIWIDTDGANPLDTTCIYRYEDSDGGSQGELAWTACPTSAVGMVYLDAYAAQMTAKSKIKTFYQADIPIAESIGDFWVDTDDNNKMYRAASQGADTIGMGEWESVRDLGVTRTAATFVIADESTSLNYKRADYVVPAGSTSAQTVIQEAIDALPADGGKVLLLDGTYIVDGPIHLPDMAVLEGQGANTVIKLRDNCPIISAAFTRATIAYLSDGTEAPSGSPRYEPGLFGKGLMFEETTTNLLTANQSSIETDLTGFQVGGGSTHEVATNEYWNGAKSLKTVLTDPDGYSYIFYPLSSPDIGTSYTFSLYVKGPVGKTFRLLQRISGGVAANLNVNTYATCTGEWQRVTVTNAIDAADRTQLELYAWGYGSAGDVFYTDGWQLEQKPHPTSWQIGGVARADEYANIPTAGVITKSPFTVEMVYTPKTGWFSGGQWLWEMFIDADNRFSLSADALGRIVFGIRSGGVMATLYNPNACVIGQSYRIMITVDGTTMRLFVEGVLVGERTYTEPVGVLPSEMYLGAYTNGNYNCNGVVEDFRISNKARTLVEHQIYVNSNKRHKVDGDTAFYRSFNQNLGNLDAIIRNMSDNGNRKIAVVNLSVDGNAYNNALHVCPNICLANVDSAIINGVFVDDSASYGVHITLGKDINIGNSTISGSADSGLFNQGSVGCKVIGNTFSANQGDGIETRTKSGTSPARGNIIGNSVGNNAQTGIYCSGEECLINSNVCASNGGNGILLTSSGDDGIVSNNTCVKNGSHGISVQSVENASIVNNTCSANSQKTDQYRHNIDAGGFFCNIQGNKCRIGDLANRPKYGIYVNGDDNVVSNNDLYQSGVSGALFDGGDGNKTTAGNRLS